MPHTHISCVAEQGPVSGAAASRARAAGWRVRDLNSGSHAMITAPRDLANLLLETT